MLGGHVGSQLAALLYAAMGGIFMGSYPVPIKAPSVLEADVHPLVFQIFKSSWVLLTGLFFLLHKGRTSYVFTWWAIGSAAAWIPSGLCTIYAVPRCGVSVAVLTTCGVNAVSAFLIFWLVFGESVRTHEIGGAKFVIAPFYMAMVLVGMAGMIFGPSKCKRMQATGSAASAALLVSPADSSDDGNTLVVRKPTSSFTPRFVAGLVAAACGGIASTAQYGLVTVGKHWEQTKAGCRCNTTLCPPELTEAFDNFGSWMVTFGIGAAAVTFGLYALLAGARRASSGCQHGGPPLHLRTLAVPGSIAGLCWCLGNFGNTAAVVNGGNSVVTAQTVSIQLTTSGLWGILYYKEARGAAAVVWLLSALWTLTFVFLLGQEKLPSHGC
jgi:glucose uptake protein GlcU